MVIFMAGWISDCVQRIRSSIYLMISLFELSSGFVFDTPILFMSKTNFIGFRYMIWSLSILNFSLDLVYSHFQESYVSNQTDLISLRLFKEMIDLIPLSRFHKRSIQGHLIISLIKSADFGLKEIRIHSPCFYSYLLRYKQCIQTLPCWVEDITRHFFVDGV